MSYLLVVILYLLIFCRNTYTLYCSNKCINLIDEYINYLINKRIYSFDINYYKEMKQDYFKFMLHFWIWDWRKMVKSQYRDLLSKFKDYNNKINKSKIKDVIYDDFEEMK